MTKLVLSYQHCLSFASSFFFFFGGGGGGGRRMWTREGSCCFSSVILTIFRVTCPQPWPWVYLCVCVCVCVYVCIYVKREREIFCNGVSKQFFFGGGVSRCPLQLPEQHDDSRRWFCEWRVAWRRGLNGRWRILLIYNAIQLQLCRKDS